MMTIAGLSPSRGTDQPTRRLETLATQDDSRAAKRRELVRDPLGNDGDVAHRDDSLVAATMQAVQGTQQNAEAATTLKDAAVAFAHELFGALRDISARSVEHAHPQRGRHQAYGNLAQRLEALASRIEAGSPAAPKRAAAPEPVVDTATEAAAAVAAEAPAEAQPVDSIEREPSPTPIAGTAPRLATAFEQFVRAQNPGAAKASAAEAGDGSSSSTELAGFLRSIAQALRSNGPAADAHAPMAGSLVNLTA